MPDPKTTPTTPPFDGAQDKLRTGVLYYGDNLEVLRRHIPDASVDLVYLDPPFNSSRSYNVLFRESGGAASEAQIEAFEDTWEWGTAAARAYEDVITGPHQQVARMLRAMVEGLRHNPVTAYLCMMAPRLVELHRALKPTGSLYLHCDPTASHYLKMILDGIFGPQNYRNEIVWQRTSAHNDPKRYGRNYDCLLYYSKTDELTWNTITIAYSAKYISSHYAQTDERGYYTTRDLSAPDHGTPSPGLRYEWKGVWPPRGRTWALVKEKMDEYDKAGLLTYSKDGMSRLKRYLDKMPGVPLQALWIDIPPVNSQAKERLGYATQKPLALLERIISASSNPGDVVLDPFCGCGTAVHAAEKLGRRWIGIDITHLAIGLIRRRMQDAFPGTQIEVIGEPRDLAGAKALSDHDKYQFQWWALDRLGAQPVAGKRKGADRGIDGVIPFPVGGTAERPQYGRAIVSVKGGGVTVKDIRDLVGVLDREKEPIGVLLTLEPPTGPMRTEAASAGFYHSDFWQKDYPRVQIITIEEMLRGTRADMPPSSSPFAQAPRERRGRQLKLE